MAGGAAMEAFGEDLRQAAWIAGASTAAACRSSARRNRAYPTPGMRHPSGVRSGRPEERRRNLADVAAGGQPGARARV